MYRNNNSDTIIAPATIPGTGAICVIRISGEEAISIASRIISPKIADAPGYTALFGRIYSASLSEGTEGRGNLIDEVITTVFRAPHSYTGEDSLEISCHSSKYIVSSIMDLFLAAGCRAAEPGEFTRRAFMNGKMDLSQAEAVADVIASSSAASHGIAMKQLKGQVSNDLSEVRAELLKITSLLELELDFSEEDVEFTSRDDLDRLCLSVSDHIAALIDSFALGNALKEGFATAIVGATNAGKSTLLNALLKEERAIVSPIAGTTRDTIEDTVTIGGVTFRFIDTAGIRESNDTIEQIGIQRSLSAMKSADVVLCVLDSTKPEESAEMIARVKETLSDNQKVYWIWNKIDEIGDGQLAGVTGENCVLADPGTFCRDFAGNETQGPASQCSDYAGNETVLKISAKEGTGVQALTDTLSKDMSSRLSSAEDTLISSRRHLEALTSSRQAITRVREGLKSSLPTDLVAEDLREVLYHLGTITGEITTPETLNHIFGNFCIGK